MMMYINIFKASIQVEAMGRKSGNHVQQAGTMREVERRGKED
jgi:hypothetical protein